MHLRTRLVPAIVFLLAATLSAHAAQVDELPGLDGEWIFVEDRTEGRAVEQQQPSMSARVTLRIENDAVVLVHRDGEIRMPLDGTATDITREGRVSRYRGSWDGSTFTYESVPVREPGDTRTGGLIRWELRVTDEGLIAKASVDPPTGFTSVALSRNPQDIAMPTPAQATIADVGWIAGAWVGTRGSRSQISIEERWGPPLGGAMLGTSPTVSGNSMRGFEYLRIVERDGGLRYIAQPGGHAPTEFVLTELLTDQAVTRAVFENPRHDSPQRIVYELSTEGGLSASIGFMNGGRPQRFEFMREAESEKQ